MPGTAAGKSHLSPSEIEIGMGIHNEPGNRRVSPVPPLKELIGQLLDFLTNTKDAERSFLPFRGGDKVVLLVNNLGGTSELELGSVVSEARQGLEARGCTVERVVAGTFMVSLHFINFFGSILTKYDQTSLNMPGFSITVLLLPTSSDKGAPSADLVLSLLDEKPNVPGWKWAAPTQPTAHVEAKKPVGAGSAASAAGAHKISAVDPKAFNTAVERACKALVQAEPEITNMDNIAGDGDCGLTLKSGAEGEWL